MTVCPYLETCEQKVCVESSRLCFGEKITDGLRFNFRLCNNHNTQHRINNNLMSEKEKKERIRKTPKEWAKGLKEVVNFT